MTTLWEKLEKIDPWAKFHFEQLLYATASQSIEGYKGGFWEPRGENLVVLPTPRLVVKLTNENNSCELHTDLITATAAVCVLALNHTAWRADAAGRGSNALNELFYAARSQALGDPNISARDVLTYID